MAEVVVPDWMEITCFQTVGGLVKVSQRGSGGWLIEPTSTPPSKPPKVGSSTSRVNATIYRLAQLACVEEAEAFELARQYAVLIAAIRRSVDAVRAAEAAVDSDRRDLAQWLEAQHAESDEEDEDEEDD